MLSNTNTQYQYYTKFLTTIENKLVRFICLIGLEISLHLFNGLVVRYAEGVLAPIFCLANQVFVAVHMFCFFLAPNAAEHVNVWYWFGIGYS